MKIGIFIQSSNQELYRKDTEALKEHYKRMAERFGEEFDIYSFTANPDQSCNYAYINNGEMLLPCNDREVGSKAYEWIQNTLHVLPRYDVVVKTNSSTVVNLKWLHWFANSAGFRNDSLYCSHYVENIYQRLKDGTLIETTDETRRYPNGNLYIFSHDILDILGRDYLEVYTHLEETTSNCKPEDNPDWIWYGVAEDFVVGCVLNRNGIRMEIVDNFVQMYQNGIFQQNLRGVGNLLGASGFSLKTGNDYGTRLAYEPDLIYTITKFIEDGTE